MLHSLQRLQSIRCHTHMQLSLPEPHMIQTGSVEIPLVRVGEIGGIVEHDAALGVP
jgi:hypothetical protein